MLIKAADDDDVDDDVDEADTAGGVDECGCGDIDDEVFRCLPLPPP